MSETKPEDRFGEGLNAPTDNERHSEFTDRADALLRWKQKTANIIDPEERVEIPKKDFAQPKKIDPTTETKGKYPIPDRQHAKSALGFAKMHGDSAAYAAVRKKVKAKYPDMLDGEEKTAEKKERSPADRAAIGAATALGGYGGAKAGGHAGARAGASVADIKHARKVKNMGRFAKFMGKGKKPFLHGLGDVIAGSAAGTVGGGLLGAAALNKAVRGSNKTKEAAKGKLSEMEKHTSKCGDCGMKMKKCACGASKMAGAVVQGLKQAGNWAVNNPGKAAVGGLGVAEGAGYVAGKRSAAKGGKPSGMLSSILPGGTGYYLGSRTKTAAGGTALAFKKKKDKVKTAFIHAMDPIVAASSVNAQKGELVVKTAGTKETAKRILDFIKTNPYARDAAVSGTAGAAMGAAGALPGTRTRGAVRGAALGAGGGMVAGEMFRRLHKTAEMEDPRAVLAGKLPERGLPKAAIEQDIDDLKRKLLGTVDEYRDIRTQLTTGPKEKKVRLPKPPPDVMEKLKLAGLKDMLDPTTLASMGLGGLVGGTGTYLASRPKKSLGGKSSGEADLETLVAAQKARGEEGASFPRRLKNRYVEFSKGLATDFRKSPGSAAAMGAVTGATAGALAAKMLGAGK